SAHGHWGHACLRPRPGWFDPRRGESSLVTQSKEPALGDVNFSWYDCELRLKDEISQRLCVGAADVGMPTGPEYTVWPGTCGDRAIRSASSSPPDRGSRSRQQSYPQRDS